MDSVVELVIENMHRLPELIPTGFRCSYTPIAAAGTDAQITQTARLLASQMTSAGLGIGAVTKGIQGNQVSIYISCSSSSSFHCSFRWKDLQLHQNDLKKRKKSLR